MKRGALRQNRFPRDIKSNDKDSPKKKCVSTEVKDTRRLSRHQTITNLQQNLRAVLAALDEEVEVFRFQHFCIMGAVSELAPSNQPQTSKMRREVLLVLKTLAKQILQEPEATVLQE
ncbi:Hypothetical predicted protein [Scomber scombrus]|uniref:Uncharacterized protein n=1 Tax=Scomber scombrus TaxID=13677 RepID=A0AAV1PRU9_SCOSC